MPAALLNWLRGESKSVRYRFWYGPMEYLSLRLHRLRGGDYLTWYAGRMDGFVNFETLESGDSDALRQFEYYMNGDPNSLGIVKGFGLEPHHTLHEFGVGFLRTAQHFIEYLDAGNFSGNDASKARIEFGSEYLRRKMAFDAKRPQLIVNTDNSFDWMGDRKVDYFWSLAVFTHMPPEDIEETFKNMRKILKPDSVILFSYSEKDASCSVERLNVKDWWHNFAFYADLAARYGFEIEDVSEAMPESVHINAATRLAKMRWRGEEATS
ncbi:MAG: class I SAM-dependent methyltransferase [Alphaproteobacteria bacterium]|nr:class I SAM-dependent methyltransferase [Alphaproteobacteria bacterium]